MKNKNQYSIEDLLDVMSELRNKCPWDQKQTFDTLKKLTIEETYELVDAIDKKKYDDIKDELGDLLLHIIFYSKIASENKKFNFNDVLNSLIEKLIYRHPHIYGDIKVSSIDEVKKNWERLKVKDKNKGILSGVPNHLPSLIKAHRVQDKVASIGFDFPNVKDTVDKIKEEFEEFNSALLSQNKSEIEDEFGDILFSLINYSRHIGIDSDESLKKSIQKFIDRFNKVEKILKSKNLDFDNCSNEELNNFWNDVKK
jgi:XTP/dITP diphosphohydrolase|tara:strand:- start:3 stop:767 length:765 start_codon:yes stop_codon:yes gene_type:complete